MTFGGTLVLKDIAGEIRQDTAQLGPHWVEWKILTSKKVETPSRYDAGYAMLRRCTRLHPETDDAATRPLCLSAPRQPMLQDQ